MTLKKIIRSRNLFEYVDRRKEKGDLYKKSYYFTILRIRTLLK